MRELGVAVDVFSSGYLLEDAGELTDLPAANQGKRAHLLRAIGHYDCVIIAGAWLPLALPIAARARRLRIPIAYAPKGQLCRVEFTRLRDCRRAAYFLLIESWLPLLATKILFTSQIEKKATLLPNSLKDAKGIILPEVFDSNRLTRAEVQSFASGPGIRLGFIAQISPRKGLLELIEAFLLVCAENPAFSLELEIAGTPLPGSQLYYAGITRRLAESPFGGRVRLLGQVSGESRALFYSAIDVLIVPSKFESYGLTLIEALWYGAAVLTSPAIGALEYLSGRPGVLVMEDGSRESIQRGLGRVIANVRQLRSTAQAGKASAPECLQGAAIMSSLLKSLGR